MIQSRTLTALLLFGLTWIGCNAAKNENGEQMNASTDQVADTAPANPVYEVAVRIVKEGQAEAFAVERSKFITQLKAQSGVSSDREFQSFYAMPKPDERPVFIGMTQYDSPEVLHTVQEKMYPAFGSFATTMDLKAYVFVQPIEGKDFDLSTLATGPGQVLELAVRKVKEGREEAFQTSRKQFVSWLDQQEGVLGSWEFEVINGQNIEGLTVGMSVYESQEAFQAIAAKAQNLAEAGAYFSTFEPVALQYAVSTTN